MQRYVNIVQTSEVHENIDNRVYSTQFLSQFQGNTFVRSMSGKSFTLASNYYHVVHSLIEVEMTVHDQPSI